MSKADEASPVEEVVRTPLDNKAIERAVMADHYRPCLYGIAGPCFHPNCLESHYKTLRSNGKLT